MWGVHLKYVPLEGWSRHDISCPLHFTPLASQRTNLRHRVEQDDASAVETEGDLMATINDRIMIHHLPIMGLGSGRTSLQDKFCTVMFAMLLEAGSSENSLSVFAQDIVAGTFDLGVEFSLSKVRPTSLRNLFPWYHIESEIEKQQQEQHHVGSPDGEDAFQVVAEQDDFFDVAAQHEPCENISLSHMLSLPGPLHILDNATNNLLDHLPYLRTAIPRLTAVSKFLSNSESKKRLLATCFSSPVSQVFHAAIKKFHARVNEGRWGSIAFAIPELRALQAPLRRFWSLDSFRSACQQRHQPGKEAEDFGPKLEVVSERIESAEFWAQIQTLDILFDLSGWKVVLATTSVVRLPP